MSNIKKKGIQKKIKQKIIGFMDYYKTVDKIQYNGILEQIKNIMDKDQLVEQIEQLYR